MTDVHSILGTSKFARQFSLSRPTVNQLLRGGPVVRRVHQLVERRLDRAESLAIEILERGPRPSRGPSTGPLDGSVLAAVQAALKKPRGLEQLAYTAGCAKASVLRAAAGLPVATRVALRLAEVTSQPAGAVITAVMETMIAGGFQQLTTSERLVLVVMAHIAKSSRSGLRVSAQTIMTATGLARGTVTRALATLHETGLLSTIGRKTAGPDAYAYTLNL